MEYSGYGIILDSPCLTTAVFLVSILGFGIAALGVPVIDSGHRMWGSIIIALGLYIAICAGLGIEFPRLYLPFSDWWKWFL